MTDQQTITTMFDDIAPRYDLLNHLLSFHFDILWRRKVSRSLAKAQPTTILDVATGTADLAIRLAKDNPEAQITGVDLSQAMLAIGQEKVKRQGLEQRILLSLADAQRLPFADHSFDAVTVAFGVRNMEHLDTALSEFQRVIRPGGVLGILEFSQPERFPMRQLYGFYVRHILPFVGRLVSKHPTAYTYLPDSIKAFNEKHNLIQLLQERGFLGVKAKRFFGGIASFYSGKKTKNS